MAKISDSEKEALTDDETKELGGPIELEYELNSDLKKPNDILVRTEIYPKRWFIMFLFTLFVIGNKFQWVQYTIILNVMTRYFSVSTLAIKSTAMVYNLSFLILIYPMTHMEHKWGLRSILVTASTCQCIGTWVKYFAISPDGYVLTMAGQTLVGAWQIIVLSMPPSIAAQWFGIDQNNTAVAVGFFGMLAGTSISSILNPIFIKDDADKKAVSASLKQVNLPVAVFCTLVMILVVLFFENEPELPPSRSRALQLHAKKKKFTFWQVLLRLTKNRNYVLLCLAHGIVGGLLLALHSLINALFLYHFKNGQEDVGRISLSLSVSGFLVAIILGKILDKTKKFKTMMIALYLSHTIIVILLGVSSYLEIKWAVYISFVLYGISLHSYHSTSMDTCSEITYPEPPIFCISVLNGVNQFFGIFIITVTDKLLSSYGDVSVYAFFVLLLAVGLILTLLIDDERKRQVANAVA